MSERDKFLTEAMGEIWYKENYHNDNFSTWPGFGKLWEWAVDQEWFYDEFLMWSHKTLKDKYGEQQGNLELLINPDRFATAIYDYLKQEK